MGESRRTAPSVLVFTTRDGVPTRYYVVVTRKVTRHGCVNDHDDNENEMRWPATLVAQVTTSRLASVISCAPSFLVTLFPRAALAFTASRIQRPRKNFQCQAIHIARAVIFLYPVLHVVSAGIVIDSRQSSQHNTNPSTVGECASTPFSLLLAVTH